MTLQKRPRLKQLAPTCFARKLTDDTLLSPLMLAPPHLLKAKFNLRAYHRVRDADTRAGWVKVSGWELLDCFSTSRCGSETKTSFDEFREMELYFTDEYSEEGLRPSRWNGPVPTHFQSLGKNEETLQQRL